MTINYNFETAPKLPWPDADTVNLDITPTTFIDKSGAECLNLGSSHIRKEFELEVDGDKMLVQCDKIIYYSNYDHPCFFGAVLSLHNIQDKYLHLLPEQESPHQEVSLIDAKRLEECRLHDRLLPGRFERPINLYPKRYRAWGANYNRWKACGMNSILPSDRAVLKKRSPFNNEVLQWDNDVVPSSSLVPRWLK